MVNRVFFLLPAVALGMACAAAIQLSPVPADHPASPHALEAPPPQPLQTLHQEPQDAAHVSSPKPGMHHMESPGQAEGHENGTGAMQDDSAPSPEASGGARAEGIYTCPMHPEVTRHQPGTCPKCGMKLIRKERPR